MRDRRAWFIFSFSSNWGRAWFWPWVWRHRHLDSSQEFKRNRFPFVWFNEAWRYPGGWVCAKWGTKLVPNDYGPTFWAFVFTVLWVHISDRFGYVKRGRFPHKSLKPTWQGHCNFRDEAFCSSIWLLRPWENIYFVINYQFLSRWQ